MDWPCDAKIHCNQYEVALINAEFYWRMEKMILFERGFDVLGLVKK